MVRANIRPADGPPMPSTPYFAAMGSLTSDVLRYRPRRDPGLIHPVESGSCLDVVTSASMAFPSRVKPMFTVVPGGVFLSTDPRSA